MKGIHMRTPFPSAQLLLAGLLVAACPGGCASTSNQPQSFVSPNQRTFVSPDAAVTSLVQCVRAGDRAELSQMLGANADEILYSGDEVADRQAAAKFLRAYD